MKLSVVIPHFYNERTGNLTTIARALQQGSMVPNEILVWNNDAPIPPIAGVKIIQADRNYGCLGRFIASFAARGEYVLFHDNDMVCRRDTVLALYDHALAIPNGIFSIDGWNFLPDLSYTEGVKTLKWGKSEKVAVEVNVTPGHIELISRAALYRVLAYFPFEDATIMEDLHFNAAAMRAGVKRYVVPSDYDYLDSCGVGISHAEDFNARRDEACKQIFC